MFKIFLASIQPLPLSNMDQEKYWTSVPSENAQQSKMRRGTGVTSPLFSVDLPVVEKKKSHTHTYSNVTGAVHLYSFHHGNSLNAFLWRLMYLTDSCIATICWSGSSWQVISWISHSEWQLGYQRAFSQWGGPVFNQALPGFRGKLHVWLQAILRSSRCTFVTS